MSNIPPPPAPTAPAALIPLKGDRGAPTFDPTRPNELPRFFGQLELLFKRCNITINTEKKFYAVSYVSNELADLWEAVPEYDDVNKTYNDFKKALLGSYTDEDNKYDMRDLDLLVGERQRLGVHALADLTDYHLRFKAISKYLINQNRMGTVDEYHAFIRGFPPRFWNTISGRLHIKHPDHRLNLPYTLEQVYDAARFVLAGVTPQSYGSSATASVTGLPGAMPSPSAHISSPDSGLVKVEQLGSILSEFSKSIIDAINNNRSRASNTSNSTPRASGCSFCGQDAHFIRECPIVEDYIRAGKCKRNNVDKRIVLPSGAFVPSNISGTYLKDRIDEWHKRNPNQIGASSLFYDVVSRADIPETHSSYILSTDERIASLQAEINNLRLRKDPNYTPMIKTRAQNARAAANANNNPAVPPPAAPVPPPAPQRAPHVIPPPTAPSGNTQTQHTIPEHPFRAIPDASYAPPHMRNVSAPEANLPQSKRPDPAYRIAPAVHNPEMVNQVFERLLHTLVPDTTVGELLAISSEISSKMRDATTPRRQQKDTNTAQLAFFEAADDESSSDDTPATHTLPVPQSTPPPGAYILPDLYDEYYKSLTPGQVPDMAILTLKSAPESSALRSIYPVINNAQYVETILDPGCQIIAMSEGICHDLGLAYDPNVVLNMQSANGSVNPSLGLARNVPFRFGDITVYLQVHIIRAPAYDVLLGRPFDVFTASVVRTFPNEDTTITITDPNSKNSATIPTHPRGRPRTMKHKFEGFHD